MVARFPLCERRQLELAVANRLDAGESQQLAEHLQGCPHCRVELEQLAGSPEWWQNARTFLSSTDNATAAPARESPGPDEPILDFLDPADDPTLLGKLGSYHVESVIGRGGMGVVLKAQDTALARPVALKILASPLAHSAAARKRFAREAQAAAAVVHDHVIPIHSVEIAGPVPFLVMPFVAGRSLQERLDEQGPLEIKEVLRIAMQTARGLAAAHAQGLVHRDIKPANILLENGASRVRITDFGLARAIDDASQTQSGFIAGTPQYMAPEQARGESVDARADLFSLGSVMYAMCAGHPPFRAETTLAVLRRICDDEPRPIRDINPDVPAWLAAIIHKLLAKSADERFQSADEIATLLERCLAHLQQPTVIPPPAVIGTTATSRSRTVLTRVQIVGLVASGILALVAVVAVARNWLAAQPSPAAATAPQTSWSAPQAVVAPAPASPIEASVAADSAAALPALSPAAIDHELDDVRAATAALEAGGHAIADSTSFADEIQILNRLVSRLERELQPRLPASIIVEPAADDPAPLTTNP